MKIAPGKFRKNWRSLRHRNEYDRGKLRTPLWSDDLLRLRISPLSSYREIMKFEYSIDPIRRLVKFRVVGRSVIGPKKRHFVFDKVVRN